MKTPESTDPNELADYALYLLSEAEELFGQRMVSPRPFIGIEFGKDFPQLMYSPLNGFKHGVQKIRLSNDAKSNLSQAIWQLAHECVHLLSSGRVTYLEEGMACWYQKYRVSLEPNRFESWAKTETGGYGPEWRCYIVATEMVDCLLSQDVNVIKRIRTIEPVIGLISVDLLMQEAPWLPRKMARKLTSQFFRRRVQVQKKNRIVRDNQPLPRKPLGQGWFRYVDGDYDRAVLAASEIGDNYFQRGKIRAAQGDTVGALSDFKQCIRLDPTHEQAHRQRGHLMAKIGDESAAERDFQQADRLALKAHLTP